MIGSIDIKLNAANPNIPLKTIFSFVDSPTSIRIIDVPKKIGKWSITQVIITATYPDNSIVSTECVLCGGVWTGTIEGSSSVGKSLNGYTIKADGIDENGNQINGYILGKGDVVIIDVDGRTIIDGKVVYLHLLDTTPEDPKEGDVIFNDDGWKIYHENDWIDFGGKSPSWGVITGDIDDQTDLKEKFTDVDDRILLTQNWLGDVERSVEETNVRVDNLSSDLDDVKDDVDGINAKIPNAASTSNQLADKDFVNSSINNFAAFYITKNANGDAFATKAELTNATVFYSGGQVRVPTKNDYCIVLEDETKTTSLGVNPTTRYTYNDQWEYQYIVNNTALTQAQVNAINSGITKDIVDKRVIPSSTWSGYAANAAYALNAEYADNTGYAEYASQCDSATYADNAAIATLANRATLAPNYTPLSTFNETLGDLSSIIQGI